MKHMNPIRAKVEYKCYQYSTKLIQFGATIRRIHIYGLHTYVYINIQADKLFWHRGSASNNTKKNIRHL